MVTVTKDILVTEDFLRNRFHSGLCPMLSLPCWQILQLWFLSLWNEFHYLLHRSICCINYQHLDNAEGGRDFTAWKGQERICTRQGYAQCSQVCMYKTLPGNQLRTQIPRLVCKFIHVPACDIRAAPCESHCFSGIHLRQLRKCLVLCQSQSSMLTKGTVSQNCPVHAESDITLAIYVLQS